MFACEVIVHSRRLMQKLFASRAAVREVPHGNRSVVFSSMNRYDAQ